MAVFQLIYQSSCRIGTTLDVLKDVARKARHANAERGITGVMLVHDSTIVQVLEGEEPAVRRLYHTISRDVRHGGCRILLTCEGGARAFGDWTMGVCEVADDDADLFRLAVSAIKARQRHKDTHLERGERAARSA